MIILCRNLIKWENNVIRQLLQCFAENPIWYFEYIAIIHCVTIAPVSVIAVCNPPWHDLVIPPCRFASLLFIYLKSLPLENVFLEKVTPTLEVEDTMPLWHYWYLRNLFSRSCSLFRRPAEVRKLIVGMFSFNLNLI